ncbi:hypothetical protein BpHYR1_053419 [Brachionus plicatilis]|uniref:Uncharacterized protein n=1 Tax=Brachionus plicatilis TaxID=10195 RepID=A0A3M7S0B3_BRAPC|nr:hypothetical protein BpHYR1_053419 [Brachionus plicatilis]
MHEIIDDFYKSKYKNLEYLIFINFLRCQILIVSIDTMSKLYFKRIRLFGIGKVVGTGEKRSNAEFYE